MDSHQKSLVRCLNGETLKPPPIWLMRQAGRYLPEYRQIRSQVGSFLDLCYTPDLAVEVTLQPIRRYDFDASIVFSDILVIPDALGRQVSFVEGKGPVLEPLGSEKDFAAIHIDGVVPHLAPVFETVRRLRKELPADKALIGFAGSPWTVAIYMIEGKGGTDGSRARRWAYAAPDEVARLMDILVVATTAYLLEQIRHGAEVIQLFDSWAGVLSESQFRDLVIEPTRRIVSGLREVYPEVPVIGFPRGSGLMIETFIAETGVEGVSLDSNIPLKWAADTLQRAVTVQGNLDNQLLAAGGGVLEKQVIQILDTLGNGPFIFNLGHGVVPDTPPENVDRVVELIRDR